VNNKLGWEDHVTYIAEKASKRLYSLGLLIRAGILETDILQVYYSMSRSVLEYALEVLNCWLAKEMDKEIERHPGKSILNNICFIGIP